jgi:hypothetical protein
MQKPIDVEMVLRAAKDCWRGERVELNNIADTVKTLTNLVKVMLCRMTPEQLLEVYKELDGETMIDRYDWDTGDRIEFEIVARLPEDRVLL